MNKKDLAAVASAHTERMADINSKYIKNSVNNTRIYLEGSRFESKKKIFPRTMVTLVSATTVEAIEMYREDEYSRMCVLNFASFNNPGGGFMKGSFAQEESLCHASDLYNVLSHDKLRQYFINNRNTETECMYENRALYTPDILINNRYLVDIISCSAPNIAAGGCEWHINKMLNKDILESRMEFMLSCCADMGAVTLILGAWGCGVFGQDPETVANLFKKLLTGKFKKNFSHIIFAVPDEDSANYKAFKKVFEKE